MHFRISVLTILALASSVLSQIPVAHCPGPVQCCGRHGSAEDPTILSMAQVLGVDIRGTPGTMIALNCNPITVTGQALSSCGETPVCCRENLLNGLINVGCVPVELNVG
ncbi:hypothetical protein BDW59DRAFT_6021 [Aspergillus cavernicola]|uniref:Hydrophobin n=1 Tax=Aspergillus cavernicola TaxID=176166 RepID=A0ABR4J5F9_9EURO